jgi:hypothetical protein
MFMTKKTIKEFWNEHKEEIVAGAAVVISGVLLGVVCKRAASEAKRLGSLKNTGVDVFDASDNTFITMCNTIDAMREGCTHYAAIPLDDIIDYVGGEEGKRMYVDRDGRQLLVTNLIAFGTEVPTC